MGLGLLGLAFMQVVSLKNINSSQFRTLATAYAYDMAERMRSNQAAVAAGSYDAIVATVTEPSCASWTAPDLPELPQLDASACTVPELAQLDGSLWNQQIKHGDYLMRLAQGSDALTKLPEGTGTVTKNGNVYDIKIAWKEQQRDSVSGKVESVDFTLSIQL
jgi:type IV pilus assembly protein PilV